MILPWPVSASMSETPSYESTDNSHRHTEAYKHCRLPQMRRSGRSSTNKLRSCFLYGRIRRSACANPVILRTATAVGQLFCYGFVRRSAPACGRRWPVFGYPSNGANGVYTVLNDAWRTGHQNSKVRIRAHGLKNSVEVFNEVYEIETDCCHVIKLSGKDRIQLP